MASPHETAAAAILDALTTLLGNAPEPTREIDLPEVCPPEGLVNLRLEDPIELGRQYGVAAREYSRIASVEIIVQANDPAIRIARHEAICEKIGVLQGATIAGVDWVDVGAPVEADVVPIEGGTTIRSGIVEITMYYRTANNPMEAV